MGRLVTRVTTDVDVLNDLFASGLVTIIGDLFMLSFVIATMFRLSPGLTLFPARRYAAGGAGHNTVPQDRFTELPAHQSGNR